MRGMGCACRRGPRASGATARPRAWRPGRRAAARTHPSCSQGRVSWSPPFLTPGSLCRVLSSFSSCLYPERTCSLEAPAPSLSASSLCLQSPPPRVCHGCPRLSAPSHISPRDGTALHPSPHSAWRAHAPRAGVTVQADTLSWKTSTPRLCLLVDTRLPPPPGVCVHTRAGAAGLAGRGGMAGTGQSPRASPGRGGVQRGSSQLTQPGKSTGSDQADHRRSWAQRLQGAEEACGAWERGQAPPPLAGAVGMVAARGCALVGRRQDTEQAAFGPAVA